EADEAAVAADGLQEGRRDQAERLALAVHTTWLEGQVEDAVGAGDPPRAERRRAIVGEAALADRVERVVDPEPALRLADEALDEVEGDPLAAAGPAEGEGPAPGGPPRPPSRAIRRPWTRASPVTVRRARFSVALTRPGARAAIAAIGGGAPALSRRASISRSRARQVIA